MIFNTLHDFYYKYQQPLAACLHEIEKVGILTHEEKLKEFQAKLRRDLDSECKKIESLIGRPCIDKKKDSKEKTDPKILNLSAPLQVMKELEKRGLKIPTKQGKKTSDETALQRLYSTSGDPFLHLVLLVRELNKLEGYAKTNLCNGVYLSIFPPCGTVGGRRSSRASWQSDQRSKISVGGNLQNFPKHSDLGMEYRNCFIARPGKIFLACDQKSADDWTINGIIADQTGITKGIDELGGRISRHSILASQLFNINLANFDKNKTHAMEYYLAKKTRYAGSYGMWGNTMSEQLAKEAHFFPKQVCDELLKKFHAAEPLIINVFQRYIENNLNKTKCLKTPIGRVRYFYGLRSFSDNSKIYREGYSYIPLSTTGDNNGLAILYLYPFTNSIYGSGELGGQIIQEVHDSTTLEVDDSLSNVKKSMEFLRQAYHRKIVFENGFEMEIPIEFEIGYSLGSMKAFNTEQELDIIYPFLNKN
jgi:DNA polymerase I-like protein with 3'-5' exonuclease and polymerase domains